ncbi:MAG: hypothetical protein PHI73_01625 [Patescibacteria group bacterium]|nr:hypothetical protein [Patescibacteria group bacterium]
MALTQRTLWSIVYRTCSPLIYHDTGGTSQKVQRVDALTRVDFQGDWSHVAQNPAVALKIPQMPAWIYYEVIQGNRYWYVVYQLYHPIDQKYYLPFSMGSHPQDLEWIMVVYDSQKDQVVAGASVFHAWWYFGAREEARVQTRSRMAYNVRPLWIDPTTQRPTFHVQAGGHGIRPYDPNRPRTGRMIYTPNTQVADVPWEVAWFSAVKPPLKSARYRLERMSEAGGIWSHRNDPNVFRRVNRQARLVMTKNGGELTASPATPVWATGDASKLIQVQSGTDIRNLSRLVVDPNGLFREVFSGIVRDRIISNPFTE